MKSNGQRVLVVDDNPAIRTTMSLLLKSRGIDHVLAEDGLDAIQRCEGQSFDVVVSDLDMPRCNGIQLARTLRERCPDTALITFSGSSGDACMEEAWRIFDFVFRKPQDCARVIDKVAEILQDKVPVPA